MSNGIPLITVTNTEINGWPSLYANEVSYIEALIAIQLDEEDAEVQCKAIGWEIFNEFKELSNGSSQAGVLGMAKISQTLINACIDWRVRKSFIELSWRGIGDLHYTW